MLQARVPDNDRVICAPEQQKIHHCDQSLQHSVYPLVFTINGFSVLGTSFDNDSLLSVLLSSIPLGADPILDNE